MQESLLLSGRSLAALAAVGFAMLAMGSRADAAPPNVVFILADDLGSCDLGCYGQTKIATPRIDRLAKEGMRFTHHYAGSNVCAPSRCVLMSGRHTGHAYIRDNRQAVGFDEGQTPVPERSLPLPISFAARGYAVGGFGKWGLGPVGSSGDPLRQGFDRWFGYNCQAKAHNHYPAALWDNDQPLRLGNRDFKANQRLPDEVDLNDERAAGAAFAAYAGPDYAPDIIAEKARQFVRDHADRPFMLYFATTIPHLALQVPDDSLAEYAGKFPETVYRGDRGYLPHRQPRAAYAAMIARMDREVGRLLDLLEELKLTERTIVVFTSDNGPLYDGVGGTDNDFFESAGALRGRKGSFYEGGFRVPCLVRWPGKIAPGSVSDRVTGFEDWLPTLLELTEAKDRTPGELDGLSFAPTLLGETQPPRPFLYRESPGYGGQQSVRVGNWKAIRVNLHPAAKATNQTPGALELYDLEADPSETTNVAAQHPQVAAELQAIMTDQHEPSPLFPMRGLD